MSSRPAIVLMLVSPTRFPVNAWPSEVKPYRPPQSGPPIVKVASCESTFVALSELGDLFTFTSPTDAAGTAGRPKWTLKPQRVWALRKQMSAVVVSWRDWLIRSLTHISPFRMLRQGKMGHSFYALNRDMSMCVRGPPSLGIWICDVSNNHPKA